MTVQAWGFFATTWAALALAFACCRGWRKTLNAWRESIIASQQYAADVTRFVAEIRRYLAAKDN